jgi:hypothetical protein
MNDIMATDLETVRQQIRALSPAERRLVRNEIDEQGGILNNSGATPDEAYQQHLVNSGLLKEVKHRTRDQCAFDRFQPVAISGPPLSETIIKERR